MKKIAATFWTYALGTRPTWGLIPVRVAFGFVLIIEALRHAESITADTLGITVTIIAIELFAGILSIPGILTRFVGAAVIVETIISLTSLRVPDVLVDDLPARILLLGIATLLLTSGAGRHSIDHWWSIRLLKRFPNKKKELYCVAETPLCKWWE